MGLKKVKKLQSDAEVRRALTAYYGEITRPGRNNRFRMSNRFGGFSTVTGWINHDQETRKLQAQTIAIIRDALAKSKSNPASLIHENEIGRTLQKTLSNSLATKATNSEFLSYFFEEYEKYLEQEFTVFLPCYSCLLPQDTKSIQFGDVSIVAYERVLDEVQENLSSNDHLTLKVFWDDKCEKLRCKIGELVDVRTIPSSRVFWRVKAVASPENLKEEALWSINVTLSLIRFFGTDWTVMFPQSPDIEKDPVIEDVDFGVDPLMVAKGNIRIPGRRLSGTYEISAKSLPFFQSKQFQKVIKQLSEAKDETIAYRMRDALGWMARGRQESDRALRLLFFFTAIEAMLSSRDKGAPITDTIARYGSIIISRTEHDRLSNYEWIKKLYSKRSETVHRGMRDSLWGHTMDAQDIAEIVAREILEKCDLTQKFSGFHETLKKASFGSDWEPKPPV